MSPLLRFDVWLLISLLLAIFVSMSVGLLVRRVMQSVLFSSSITVCSILHELLTSASGPNQFHCRVEI